VRVLGGIFHSLSQFPIAVFLCGSLTSTGTACSFSITANMAVHQLVTTKASREFYVNVLSVIEPQEGAVELGEVEVTQMIEMADYEDVDFPPPSLAMGTFPEAICCSLSNIVVVIIRRKGLIAAFELEDDDLSLIAQEGVGHYVVDAVMRYSAEVGGAEIVMLLSDNEDLKDGRIVSFCFRSAA
jgi:hypothetical protein